MPRGTGDFKPYVGRLFELKSYTDLKKFPQVILVMDETKKQVMFLDNGGNATWINKFYIRDKPIESKVFASADTLTEAMGLIERLRDERAGMLGRQVPADPDTTKQVKKLNKDCARILQELRDLGSRMQGVRFAPPIEEEAADPKQEEETTADAVQ